MIGCIRERCCFFLSSVVGGGGLLFHLNGIATSVVVIIVVMNEGSDSLNGGNVGVCHVVCVDSIQAENIPVACFLNELPMERYGFTSEESVVLHVVKGFGDGCRIPHDLLWDATNIHASTTVSSFFHHGHLFTIRCCSTCRCNPSTSGTYNQIIKMIFCILLCRTILRLRISSTTSRHVRSLCVRSMSKHESITSKRGTNSSSCPICMISERCDDSSYIVIDTTTIIFICGGYGCKRCNGKVGKTIRRRYRRSLLLRQCEKQRTSATNVNQHQGSQCP
mmetsp:Transcript_25085/g.36855  ORF Transcript_25085/g.36855 Transcript_25085/m.36855 type:complete len:278 (+) Transcript_25085:1214-2047(+)